MALNDGQTKALEEIITSFKAKRSKHRLNGPAGVGKTYLMQEVVRVARNLPRYGEEGPATFGVQPIEKKSIPAFFRGDVDAMEAQDKERMSQPRKARVRVGVTAPTHKAVEVLRRKLHEAGLVDVAATCMTIHAMLGLKPGVSDSEKMILKRSGGKGCTGDFDFIIIDECSMIGSDLQAFIDNDLQFHFVLYVGDSAQLPPVGEDIAPCFEFGEAQNCGVSELTEIVRQEAGNPIIKASTVLRVQQGTGRMDWSWCDPASDGAHGIYLAGDDADMWMQNAFTSEDFEKDNDSFRYIAYTNERVKEVNSKVRQWIYGDTPTPFVEGERIMCRNPVKDEDDKVVFSTNQEAIVTSIEAGIREFTFYAVAAGPGKESLPTWRYNLPVWKVGLQHPSAGEVICDMARSEQEVKNLDRRLITEAKANRERWYSRFQFLEAISDLRCVYALTAHSSQGSTFGNGFLDIPDISKRERSNVLECQKLLYVGLTRFKQAVVLIGIR